MPNAIVLGGSAGIGRAIVDALVERGHSVGVVARGRDRLAALEVDHAGRVTTASADVGDAAALSAAVDTLMADGAPTIWVNCAMATSFSRFAEMEVEEFDRIVRTTFLGQVNGMRLALKHGRTSSSPVTTTSHHAPSRAAKESLTRWRQVRRLPRCLLRD